jgi:hypothetical protein
LAADAASATGVAGAGASGSFFWQAPSAASAMIATEAA